MPMRPFRRPFFARFLRSVRCVLGGVGWAAGLLAGGAVLQSRPARASIVMALDLPDLVQQADQIALVDVLSQHADWDSKHERILSTIELRVVERWKGNGSAPGGAATPAAGAPSDRIMVIQ